VLRRKQDKRPTSGCFLSPDLSKATASNWKGKASSAVVGIEDDPPVCDISEGRRQGQARVASQARKGDYLKEEGDRDDGGIRPRQTQEAADALLR